MLHVHRSESGHALVRGLAQLLAEPVADPLVAEVVAVPARGVERWLAQQLSNRLSAGELSDGVCANVSFTHPSELLDSVIASGSPEHVEAVAAWQPERAGWQLLDVLDACPADEDWCAGLHRHLATDEDLPSLRRYAVARRLALLFHSYGEARPAILRAWARRDDSGVPGDLLWQPELWRRLRNRIGVPSPPELLDDACAHLRAHPDQAGLPHRLSLYGVSRVDAARLQVLAALAEHRDVHLWINHASPALWDGLRRVRPASSSRAATSSAMSISEHLLASMSRDVRELQLRLQAAAPGLTDTHHPPPGPRPFSLLHSLQENLSRDAKPQTRPVVDPDDRSIQVHACHGRTRQVEVLREALLGLLRDDPTLEPRDVLVMCPDVEAFAPLVAAVFGTDSHPGAGLRVTVADRSPRQTNPLLAVAADLLDLAGGRVTASQLLDLAGAPPVRLRFGFDEDDVEQLRDWTIATGVRWGLGPHHRGHWQMAHLPEGTWLAGMDRLLTGVAMGEHDVLLDTALPLGGVDSSAVDLAGRFAELLDRVDAAVELLSGRHHINGWLDILENAVHELADAPRDGTWQLVQLRLVLNEIRETAADSSAELTLADVSARHTCRRGSSNGWDASSGTPRR